MFSAKKFKTVLVIDDDPTCIYLAKSILEDLNIAQQILTASHGREGIEKIKQTCLNSIEECTDLILLDINMPFMSGFEVVEELVRMGKNHFIESSIVVLTSSSNARDIEKMTSYGVKQYLVKPVTEEKILSIA